MDSNRTDYTDAAYSDIQDKRERWPVTVGPGGTLHNYVPFFFAPKSPMLFALCRYPRYGSTVSRNSLIQIVTTVEQVVSSGHEFIFTNGHAIMRITDQFNDVSDLDKIDWEVIRGQYWNDIDNDMDRRRRRMDEFLVHQELPMGDALEICTQNGATAEVARGILEDTGFPIPVKVRSDWYY